MGNLWLLEDSQFSSEMYSLKTTHDGMVHTPRHTEAALNRLSTIEIRAQMEFRMKGRYN